MGGFSSSVQAPQTGGQSSGKGQFGNTNGNSLSQMDTPEQLSQMDMPQQPMQTQQYQPSRPMGKGGVQTNSATSGQPTMGAPNQYPNTVGQWDNSQIQPLQPKRGGKGKGG